jgi:DNA topoisomerase-1
MKGHKKLQITNHQSQTANKSLVIVESPAKAKTINKYLGPDFEVQASMGHVRDLPSKGLNVDIENNFSPTYDIMPGKRRTVNSLKAAAKKCQQLYLATDLDREGEAIAWHLAQILGIPEERTFRVIFNAITESAIKKAFSEPGKIDNDKVLAQQARRILDRIVGYQISPLLWKKVARGLSAGRVQSVAVKMIVEKEREIRAFVPVEYWLIPAVFTTDLQNDISKQWADFLAVIDSEDKGPTVDKQNKWLSEHDAFRAELYKIGGEKFHAPDKDRAEKIFNALKDAEFKIAKIDKKEVLSRPSPPFITSTLQQAASNRLYFSADKTMRVAQQLYEGIDLGTMGSLGLITYMRTDSTHIASEAIGEVRNYIKRQIGDSYLPEKANFYASNKSAQQAHEAIRPTDVDYEPDKLKQFLTDEQYKLYDLIWRRFVASQMSAARWDVTTLDITGKTALGDCLYRATGRLMVFDGFTRIWPVTSAEQPLPDVQMEQKLAVVHIKPEQHFTKPPARYNEASLVKALEREGIGRPSTYAAIISTIQERGYVEQRKRQFYASALGELVTDKLNQYFPRIMDIAFTRHMEGQLDKIEEQHLDWLQVLQEFYGPFRENLETALAEMKHAKAETTPSKYVCPKCNKPLVYRFGRNGRFLSCSGYPQCRFACPCDEEGKMVEQKTTEHKCPKCGKAMVERLGRFGKFLGCSDFPNCRTILNLDKDGNVLPEKKAAEPTGLKCYKCKDGQLVIRQSRKGPFLGCNNYPRCRTIVSVKQLEKLKKMQAEGTWPPQSIEQAEKILGRKKTSAKTPQRHNKT